MAELLQPDFCVIGRGAGALTAATGAAALGARVVLVRYGPSSPALKLQALFAAASRAQEVRSADHFGVSAGEVRIDFRKLKEHVRRVAAAAAPNETPERLAGLGIRAIDGVPRFNGVSKLAIDDRFEIKPKHVVIAIGSTPTAPAIEGLDGEALTPEAIFELDEIPESVAILGASALGLELAQAFLRLGASVTVVDPERPLPEEDAECAALLLQHLQAQGVSFCKGRPVRAARSGNAIELTVDRPGAPETIHASRVILARGGRPAFGDLDLAAGGIAADDFGITVDDYLRSSNSNVFAIGESAGSHSVAAAKQHAAIVVRNVLLGAKSAADGDVVPRVIFVDPEFAHVGLVEQRARALHGAIHVQRSPFHQNDRARAENDTNGHIKIVTLPGGTILGTTIVGRGAGEQIAVWALAVERGLSVHDLSGWILPYPSRAEAGKQALTAVLDGGLTRPAPGRIISLLRRRG